MATRKQKPKLTKKLLFTFEYTVNAEDVEGIPEILEKMRETGAAEIVDVEFDEDEEES